MSGTLKDFLVDLACDPDRLARFVADPEGEIERAGLDARDRAAILSRDSRAVHRAISAVPTDHMTQTFIVKPKGVARKRAAKKAGARKAARKTGARKSAKKR